MQHGGHNQDRANQFCTVKCLGIYLANINFLIPGIPLDIHRFSFQCLILPGQRRITKALNTKQGESTCRVFPFLYIQNDSINSKETWHHTTRVNVVKYMPFIYYIFLNKRLLIKGKRHSKQHGAGMYQTGCEFQVVSSAYHFKNSTTLSLG